MGEERDTQTIGRLAAEVMEFVDQYEGKATTGVVAVVVEVNVDVPDEPGYTEIAYRCSDNRRWVQAGLFDSATRAVLAGD